MSAILRRSRPTTATATRQRLLFVKVVRAAATESAVEGKNLSGPFPAKYSASTVESGWYDWWEERGFFRPRKARNADAFSMVLPPPNVTGSLHLGHALTCVIQDALVRWHRMRGQQTVWIPGSDHAGIATQMAVERSLAKRGLVRTSLGREEFAKELSSWRRDKGDAIFRQLRRMGASLDWERTCFTLSEDHTRAVNRAFCTLFDRGLIYRGNFLVNWCCHLRTAISDIEVEHIHLQRPTKIKVPGYDEGVEFGVIYDLAYKLEDTDSEIVVSTTRPETMLGDTCVAVHPDDQRYAGLAGRYLQHPFRSRSEPLGMIPVVSDVSVNPKLGSGAVKVTPAHSQADLEVAKKQNMEEMLSVINEEGNINLEGTLFHNLPRFEARNLVVSELSRRGLFRGRRAHPMSVPVCSRSGDVIEPLLRPQWFLRCEDMAKRALEAVENGELLLEPESQRSQWSHWLSNIRDWCLSRQLWWGHQIPLYRCKSGTDHWWIAAESEAEALEKANRRFQCRDWTVTQEEDVLDTWFSSAIIPFADCGWPSETEDLRRFYPLSMMETGHDILFFWVARMAMLGAELTGKMPFKTVLLHGIICDAHGRKMSKSLGNVVDPMHVINGISLEDLEQGVQASNASGHIADSEMSKALAGLRSGFPEGIPSCGSDGLRFGLCSYDVKSQQMNLDMMKMKSASLFCNKLWQAARFLMMAWERSTEKMWSLDMAREADTLRPEDRWILSCCALTVRDVNEELARANFHMVTRSMRKLFYSHICDTYLELCKPRLHDNRHPEFGIALRVLHHCFITGLKLLHPIMPFITEELFQRIPALDDVEKEESIVVAKFPCFADWTHLLDEQLLADMNSALETVSAIRGLKADYGLQKQVDLDCKILRLNIADQSNVDLTGLSEVIRSHAKMGTVEVSCNEELMPGSYASVVVADGLHKAYVNVKGLINVDKELEKNEKRKAKAVREAARLERRFQINDKVQDEERRRWQDRLETLMNVIKSLEEQKAFLKAYERNMSTVR